MKLKNWLALRGPAFIRERGAALLKRYGLTPSKAQKRIERCMATLARYDCAPTFPTPGRIVQNHTRFIRALQDAGAEIAVHSYDHVDLKAYSAIEAKQQLVRAVDTFDHHGIQVHGFRCPYLSYTDEMIDALPKGMFGYSSNAAIQWDCLPKGDGVTGSAFANTINQFYRPRSARDTMSVPWMRNDKLEIPVCVPDDLQLHDGLHLAPHQVAQVWGNILEQTHRRGEMFTLLFHPELAGHSDELLGLVLEQARCLEPRVWIARLRDINTWWREKAGFEVEISENGDLRSISFLCSERATLLAKNMVIDQSEPSWDGHYVRLRERTIRVPTGPLPLVGLAGGTSEQVVNTLREQGYVLRIGHRANECAIFMDRTTLVRLNSNTELLNYIESSPGPLVRYGPWPNGAKSAMCVTGDLDALTLGDYASRLIVH